MKALNRVFVALGSNIEPERNLREAVRLLASRCRLLAVSAVYQTQPVGKTDQPDFLNAAALIETELGAAELKTRVLQDIERALGRVRSADKNAPRTIDLDITLFNDTLAHNIAYGNLGNVSEEQIIEAAKAAYAWEFIKELPEGL